MRKVKVPEYGVEIFEGLPGAGKSLEATREIIEERLLVAKRPVYTNVPLKFRLVRRFVQRKSGSPHVANLLQELRLEHFTAFMRRFVLREEFFRPHKTLRGLTRPADELEAEFEKINGPSIVDGERDDANWIPGASCIYIDEAHRWFPGQAIAGRGDENPDLEKFLSMHRHAWYLVAMLTQDRMKLSMTVRRNCTRFTVCRDMSEDKLVWSLRFKHIGLKALGRTAYTGDQVLARSSDNATPIENTVTLPSLPWNRWLFRVYESFTNAGTVNMTERELATARAVAGLSPSGVDDEQGESTMADEVKAAVRGKWGGRLKALGLVVLGVVLASVLFGRRPAAATPAAESVGKIDAKGVPSVAGGPKWPKFAGVVNGAAVFDGERLAPGDASPTVGRLVAADVSGCLVVRDGECWMFRVGKQDPERLGRADLVLAGIAARARAAGARGQQSAGEPAGGGVGPAPGSGPVERPASP